MNFSLIQDFADTLDAMPTEHPRRRILKLIHEAIRRDVHFIDRHPTTLFQCLWNSCWWYDCRDVVKHGAFPFADQARQCMLESMLRLRSWVTYNVSSFVLFQVAVDWQLRKEQYTPGFRWLRSLRPPAESLSGRSRDLAGHLKPLKLVDVSPDGTRVISAGQENWIGVWSGETGQLQSRKYLSSRSVTIAKCGPTGRWFAGLSYHGRATVAWDSKTLWETYIPQNELERFLFDDPPRPSRFAVKFEQGDVVICGDSGTEMACAADLQQFCSDDQGRLWAGYVGTYVGIYRLEGDL